jgi:hypothetical protein
VNKTASDLAQLSSVRSQLDELTARVTSIAGRYQETPDSAVAVDLFEAERNLASAGRVIERALAALGDIKS